MKNLLFFVTVSLIALFTACTTQVQQDLPEPETTKTTIDDNDEVILRSTAAECDSLEDELTVPVPTGTEAADLFECRLNQGYDESYIQNECTFSESYTYETCAYWEDIKEDPSTVVLREQREVADSTTDCTAPCTNPHAALGCRKVIWSVVFLNDDNCPGAPDEWEFRITADVYCCD